MGRRVTCRSGRLSKFLCAALIAVSAGVALVPAASAETRTLVGSVAGNPGSKLVVKIQRLGGAPFRILSFEFRRLTPRCFGETPSGRISGKVGKMKIERGSNPFDPAKRTNVFFSRDGQTTKDRRIGVFITGITNRKATRTSGNLGISFGDGCSADSGTGFSKFTASR
jgi:hypothetical protein